MKYYKAEDVINLLATEYYTYKQAEIIEVEDCKAAATFNTKHLPTIEISEDCISKAYLEQEIENQAMTVEKDKEYWRGWNNSLDKVVELIEDAPPVVPSRAEGEWINKHEWTNGFYERECSICGAMKPQLMHTAKINFCPNCGEKMEG